MTFVAIEFEQCSFLLFQQIKGSMCKNWPPVEGPSEQTGGSTSPS